MHVLFDNTPADTGSSQFFEVIAKALYKELIELWALRLGRIAEEGKSPFIFQGNLGWWNIIVWPDKSKEEVPSIHFGLWNGPLWEASSSPTVMGVQNHRFYQNQRDFLIPSYRLAPFGGDGGLVSAHWWEARKAT